jgi:hypothetical protein
LSLQKHTDAIDAQIALFSRNNYLHFTPDSLGVTVQWHFTTGHAI